MGEKGGRGEELGDVEGKEQLLGYIVWEKNFFNFLKGDQVGFYSFLWCNFSLIFLSLNFDCGNSLLTDKSTFLLL